MGKITNFLLIDLVLDNTLTGFWGREPTTSLLPNIVRVRYWGKGTTPCIMRTSHFVT